MMPGTAPNRENCTLTDAELAACQPVAGEGGQVLRAFCPFHGSDHQRSLRVQLRSGRFLCFACGAWGYLAAARERWQEERQRQGTVQPRGVRSQRARQQRPAAPARSQPTRPLETPRDPAPAWPDLVQHLTTFQAALPGSRGAAYLQQRGIPLALAQQYGVGYAAPGRWPHQSRDWRGGRVVFPHTTREGRLVNLYGRAVGTAAQVPKAMRHDHLPGDKGYFNAVALCEGTVPLCVCEGPFDALSLLAAGMPRVVAIFGVHGWRWEWAREISQMIFALDADPTGQHHWRLLARQAVLRGKQVGVLPVTAYGGYKDVNAAWTAGVFVLPDLPSAGGRQPAGLHHPDVWQEQWEERAAIMEWEGGLGHAEAERAARHRLHKRAATPMGELPTVSIVDADPTTEATEDAAHSSVRSF